jgi:hypothetical protein
MPVEPSDAAGIGDFPSAACTRKALKKRVDFISLLMGAVNVIGSKDYQGGLSDHVRQARLI